MSDFGKKNKVQQSGEKRIAPRFKANAPALIQTTASQLPVTISDISATGARVVSSGPPPSRQDVRLYVNGIWLFGRIAWRREKAFGVKFDDGINDYCPDELHKAVAEASMHGNEFDREAILSDLANKEPSRLEEIEEDVHYS